MHGETAMLDQRSASWLQVIGRPKPGVSASQAGARLKTLAPDAFKATLPANLKVEMPAGYLKRTFDTQPAATGLSSVRRQYRQALMILMVIVGVVLLIACANVANLLLARSAARQREMAIRMAMGSGRARLMRQLLTESLVLALTGAALGMLFAQWGARLLIGLLSTFRTKVFLDLTVDARVLAFTAGVAILTGLLFGVAPAWRSTRVNPQSAMKASARGVIEGSKFGLGKALVVAQVALSLVLVVGAGLMLRTFFNLETLDAGFDREHVLIVNIDLRNGHYPQERRNAVFQEMRERIRALPGVRSSSDSNMSPTGGGSWSENLRIEGYTSRGHGDTLVYLNEVSDRYFETLATSLVAGRDFNAHDTPESPRVAIVNETLAKKFFPGQNPIGRRYREDTMDKTSDAVEIVGVVKDARYSSLREEVFPFAYVAASQNTRLPAYRNFQVRAAAGEPTALISGAKSALANVNRDVSLEFTTLAMQVDASLSRERLLATLSGFFGGLALTLAMIGLYGLMSYNVARRRNEIGIRIALGAEQSRVLRMVLGEVAVLGAAGLGIGLGAAIGATRFLASFLYGMKPNDPWTLSLSAGVLALVAALAGFLPARRASRLDPMAALRDE
jgi:predicted permease